MSHRQTNPRQPSSVRATQPNSSRTQHSSLRPSALPTPIRGRATCLPDRRRPELRLLASDLRPTQQIASEHGRTSTREEPGVDSEQRRQEQKIRRRSMDKEEPGANEIKEASVSVSNVDEDDDTDINDVEDEDDDHGKHTMVLGPQVPLKDHLELDKDDDSLRRWKEQLLRDVDTTKLGETAEPEVTILNLTILTPGRPDLVLPIPFVPDDKGYTFALKDGSTYSFRFSFTVSNNIVSGLKYTHTIWKAGVRVENQKVMLGTFSPRQEPYIYEAEEDNTPSGMFARGSYSAKLKFVDDDGKVYLDMIYCFEIRKDWPA